MLKIDFFILEQIVAELKVRIVGASLAKVHQPSEDSLVLRLWNGRQNLKLLLKVGLGSRLHLTQQEFNNPFHPPRFCQLLRSRLKRLESIDLVGYDPVVSFSFSGIDQTYRLVCELLGNRSNLYLLDARGGLVDALFKPQTIGDRQLRRGDLYTPLPSPERLQLSDPLLEPPLDVKDAEQFEKWLLKDVTPMSKGQALVLNAAVEEPDSILLIFEQFKRSWIAKSGSLSLVDVAGQMHLVGYLPATLLASKSAGESSSEFIDQCFSPTETRDTESGERARFRKIISTQIVRLQKRQKNIRTQQDKTEDFDQRRQLGELLLANLHLVKKGMGQVEVTDWSADPPELVTIKLRPELNPQENAEKLFQRYKKEKRGVEHIDRRQQETRDELEWLESLLLALDEAVEAIEVNEIAHELLAAGLIFAKKGEPASRRKVSGDPRLNQTLSPGGLRIFWGRNNRSNDHLSAHMTDRDDLWFHAYNMPGCHLVLKREGLKGDLPGEDIAYAASIAAGYSRGKDDSSVDVIVTEGRHVRRPKGAKPGLVTVSEHRTLRVAPLRAPAEGNPLES